MYIGQLKIYIRMMMSFKSSFELMAKYNQEMNRSVYHAASNLSQSKLGKNQGAYFGSIIYLLPI